MLFMYNSLFKEAVARKCCKKVLFEISLNSQKKTCVWSLQLYLKKILLYMCFPVNLATFLKTPFLTEHLQWLLLYLLRLYFKVTMRWVLVYTKTPTNWLGMQINDLYKSRYYIHLSNRTTSILRQANNTKKGEIKTNNFLQKCYDTIVLNLLKCIWYT